MYETAPIIRPLRSVSPRLFFSKNFPQKKKLESTISWQLRSLISCFQKFSDCCRSSPLEVSCLKGILKIFRKFPGKYSWGSTFSVKLLCNLTESSLCHKCKYVETTLSHILKRLAVFILQLLKCVIYLSYRWSSKQYA